MKANELRSGSVISINGENVIVDHIKCHEDSVTIKNGFAIVFNDGDLETDGNDNIKPIVLTPEILEKCGFEYVTDWTVRDKRKHDCVTFLDLGYMYLASGMMGGGVTLFQNDRRSTGTNIDYLHQLQNLYFCLVGKELQVKL